VLRSLQADIWVTSHARLFGRYRKFVARTDAANPADPFIDPEGYRAYIDSGEARFRRGSCTSSAVQPHALQLVTIWRRRERNRCAADVIDVCMTRTTRNLQSAERFSRSCSCCSQCCRSCSATVSPRRVKVAVNQKLDARVEWRRVGLSLFRDFPNLAVTLEDLTAVGVADSRPIPSPWSPTFG
jgi:hypothetical protein